MEPVPFVARLFLAWLVYFKVLFDGTFAAKVSALGKGRELAPIEEPKKLEAKVEEKAEVKEPDFSSALQLLSLLQREGRLVDFLEEDIAGAADADIGAAARVVHDGCRKALREHVELVAIREEDEGVKLTLQEGFDAKSVKLTGNVQGKGPFSGSLRHKGWRAKKITLPTAVAGHDAAILAQAEVEL